MRRRAWPVIALAAPLTSVAAMAHASPPNPSWIAGIYDESDFDDVVALVTQAASSIHTTSQDDRSPEPVVVEFLGPISEQAPLSSPLSPTRGPPAV